MELIKSLEWRYATKKMNPSKTVSEDKIERIVEAANSSGRAPNRSTAKPAAAWPMPELAPVMRMTLSWRRMVRRA